ncbi:MULTISPECIES: non-ribosomal peptide synthetase [Bacillus]|uniref:non-ribosomal peptide synthetase n=1 Tax=Bacillus TaxID=1386 RepID=UPI0003734848|nr:MULTISPECIES: non-ribosomal peptide synthetase [Bacillus]PGS04522.1 non-ribosomal peptide synthetase [Bacillus pseudomycoides]PHE58093.1 non-ribosomal peptide synthetase [Bacillus pseudomycoides]
MDKELPYYPLTHPQKRIWYTEHLNPGVPLNNLGGLVKIEGAINFDMLEKAIQIFIKKNEALRIRIFEKDGKPNQYIQKYEEEDIEFLDFCTQKDSFTSVQKVLQKEFVKPINLFGKLYEFMLVKINNNLSGYFIKLHHIISDGWTFQILTDQINGIYKKLVNNEAVNEEVEYSYLDFIQREQKYLNSKRFIKDRDYWKENIGEFKNYENTETDLAGNRLSLKLDSKLTDLVKEFLLETGYSMNSLFIYLVSIYLHKFESYSEMVIGIPILNRIGYKEKQSVGMFTSTMPLRIMVDSNESIENGIKKLSNKLFKSYKHQNYPYNILIQDIKLREKSINDLFKIAVNYYNTKFENSIDGLNILYEEFYSGYQLNSLQIAVKEWSGERHIELQYDYHLSHYNEADIKLLHKRLQLLLNQFIKNPLSYVSQLELLDKNDFEKIIYERNDTKVDYPIEKTVVQLFEGKVNSNPLAIALEHDRKKLSFIELNDQANQLAHFLIRNNLGKNSIVGLYMSNSIEMIVSILAILKVGGAYLPLDPSNPVERNDFILEDSNADFLIVKDEKYNGSFKGQYIQYDDNLFSGERKGNLNNLNMSTDLAYIIYTSGTTGKPKGSLIDHRSLMNYISFARDKYLETVDIFAFYSSLSFDLTVTSIFAPLVNGSKIIIYQEDGGEFIIDKILKDNKVSIIKLTPSHLSLIQNKTYKNSSLRKIIVGGEDLTTSLARRTYHNFGQKVEIYNEYGPTETVVGCVVHQYNPYKDKSGSVPIGTPIQNTQVYVLDEDMKPVPNNVVGELYISGDGVTKGYLNLADITKTRFVDNPYIKGKKMFKTGDYAKYTIGGNLVYVGRRDSQVKIQGNRIDILEIKHHLLSIKGISEVVVTIDEETILDSKLLVAYLVTDKHFTQQDLFFELSKKMPSYMIPTKFEFISEIPLTNNGKVNTHKIKDYIIDNTVDDEHHRNLTDVEGKLLLIIKEVLGISNIELNDNFFHIGGDSIKAIQVASRAHACGINLDVKDILRNPIIEMMLNKAEYLETGMVENTLVDGCVKSTPIMEWFFALNLSNEHHYNQSVNMDLKVDIPYQTWKEIMYILVIRHDSLRLNYNDSDARLSYMPIKDKDDIELQYYDLSEYSEKVQSEMIESLSINLKGSFRLGKGILIKGIIFNKGKGKQKVVLTAHHLIIDGVSWRILLEDISSLIEDYLQERSLQLNSHKTSSYKSWAEYIENISKEITQNETEYWDTITEKIKNIPFDFNKGKDTLKYTETISKQLTPSETTTLCTKANNPYNTRVEDLLLASLSLAINNIFDEKSMTIELEGHGRLTSVEDYYFARTVGWFTAIFPFTLAESSGLISNTIKSTKERLRNIPNEGIGYGILRFIKQDLYATRTPSIKFNYLGELDAGINKDIFDLDINLNQNETSLENEMSNPIEMNIFIENKIMKFFITYSKNKFHDKKIARFMDNYILVLRNIIKYCCNTKEVEFTPSDFDSVQLTQKDLDNIFN